MQTIIPNEIQQIAQDTYRTVRQKCVVNSVITVLHITDEYSFMAQGTNTDKPDNVWVFEIGTEKTAREFFIHNPPTAGEVENAIQVVEDEVMPLHKLLTVDSNLYTSNARVLEIARVSAFEKTEQGTILSIQDMEHTFTRLAAIISGRPASQDILPTGNTFAATLLILREVMHHLRFRNITIC